MQKERSEKGKTISKKGIPFNNRMLFTEIIMFPTPNNLIVIAKNPAQTCNVRFDLEMSRKNSLSEKKKRSNYKITTLLRKRSYDSSSSASTPNLLL